MSFNTFNNFNKSNVVKITNVLGREISFEYDKILFFHFDDGRIEKRIIIK